MPQFIIPNSPPSWAIGHEYESHLLHFTHAMLNDVLHHIEAVYRQHNAVICNIVGDANPITALSKELRIRMGYWIKFATLHAKSKATIFVDQIQDKVYNHYKQEINRNKLIKQLTVGLNKRSKRALYTKQATIADNVNLITNISLVLKERITRIVMEASQRGRDFKYLESELEKTNEFAAWRVKLIARDQLNKATEVMNTASLVDLGFKQGVWNHSNASVVPRQSHLHANGKVYRLDQGCLIDGEYIYPAQLIGCNCFVTGMFDF